MDVTLLDDAVHAVKCPNPKKLSAFRPSNHCLPSFLEPSFGGISARTRTGRDGYLLPALIRAHR